MNDDDEDGDSFAQFMADTGQVCAVTYLIEGYRFYEI